jgi:Ras-related protein Rab-5C
VKELQRQGNSNLLITLVGNKTDLINDREVPKEEVDVYIKEECKLLYIETSAKLGTNIHHVFTEIGMGCYNIR